ncbi:hypothetical protein D3C83_19880 [compost metagenome]
MYRIEGEIARLRIPPPRPPQRAEGLWQHTCCELFACGPDAPAYREFNFAPSGEWAAYEFRGYREGARPLDSAVEIRVKQAAGRLELAASIPFSADRARLGLCAVVEEQESGALSYWALRHAPGKPDFHHPVAFALELP